MPLQFFFVFYRDVDKRKSTGANIEKRRGVNLEKGETIVKQA